MKHKVSPINLSERDISARLQKTYAVPYEEAYPSVLRSDAPRPAAVLVPLLKKYLPEYREQVWHILLTRRADTLLEHTGQVAYPGGRSDVEDRSPEATALREAQEEIGINPDDVRLLGRLNSVLTISNYMVTPVVGVIPWPFKFRLAEHEVSRIFTIPFAWLADPKNYIVKQREVPELYASIVGSNQYPVIYFNPYDGEKLWGVSAEITVRLIRTLTV